MTFREFLIEGNLKQGDFVTNKDGEVGNIEHISSDGEIVGVKWNSGKSTEVEFSKLTKFKNKSK